MTSYSTATEILAAAVRARKVSSAVLARDLGIPHAPLHNFAHCNGTLPPQVVCTENPIRVYRMIESARLAR